MSELTDKNITIKQIKLNDEIIEINDEQILNPFFVGINGGSLLNLEPKLMYQNYKYVYVMCLSNNNDDIIKLFNNVIELETLKKYVKILDL